MICMEKKHIEWIDYIKGVCILCVMIHHAKPLDIWDRLLAPFFLSAFFFVSGYTFTSKNGFRNFIIKKTRALVIPLVSLSLINGIVGVLFKGIPLRNRIMNLILEVAPNNDTLWFFACLFSASILFYAVNQMVQSSIGIIIVSNILSASGLIYIAGGAKDYCGSLN